MVQGADLKKVFIALAISVAIVLLCFFFGSCRTKYTETQTEYKYKEVPVEVHDTLFRYTLFRDTSFVHDSIFIHQKGDTVYNERWHTAYQYKYKTDTVSKYREVPVEVHDTTYIDKSKVETKEVERSKNWFEKTTEFTGSFVIFAILIFLFYKLYRKYKG